jgi:hypothetical protein
MPDGENQNQGGEGAGGAAGGSAGGASGAPWYANVQGADDAFTGVLASKGWAAMKPEELAVTAVRAFRNAESVIGVPPEELLRVPKDANGDWSKVYQRIGKPEKMDGYDFTGVKFKDGTDPDAKFLGVVREAAWKNNLTKDAAKGVTTEVLKFLEGESEAQSAEATAKLGESKAALAKRWGVMPDQIQNSAQFAVAKSAVAKLGWTPEIVNALESAAGYEKVMEALRDLGSRMGEDTFIKSPDGGSNLTGAMTAEQAQMRKSALMQDNAWITRYNNGDVEARAEMSNLNKILVAAMTPPPSHV